MNVKTVAQRYEMVGFVDFETGQLDGLLEILDDDVALLRDDARMAWRVCRPIDDGDTSEPERAGTQEFECVGRLHGHDVDPDEIAEWLNPGHIAVETIAGDVHVAVPVSGGDDE